MITLSIMMEYFKWVICMSCPWDRFFCDDVSQAGKVEGNLLVLAPLEIIRKEYLWL